VHADDIYPRFRVAHLSQPLDNRLLQSLPLATAMIITNPVKKSNDPPVQSAQEVLHHRAIFTAEIAKNLCALGVLCGELEPDCTGRK